MPLFRTATQVPVGTVDMQVASFSTTMVHGTFASLMLAERPSGYHSRPHTHPCEQLNLVQAGEAHVYFGDGRAFVLRPGDVLRIPADMVHWSWNKAEEPCTAIEVHAPGLQSDPEMAAFAVGLFDDGEESEPPEHPVSVDAPLSDAEIARIEGLSPVSPTR